MKKRDDKFSETISNEWEGEDELGESESDEAY